MRILAMKPGHDGHVAYIDDGKLIFSYEAEKDSWGRYSECGPVHLVQALSQVDSMPEVIAMSGWAKVVYSDVPSPGAIPAVRRDVRPLEGGYFGEHSPEKAVHVIPFLGAQVKYFTSSHERSHVFCSFGLSRLLQGEECYVLVWEGSIGSFYHLSSDMQLTKVGTPLTFPGLRYQLLYGLADPGYMPGKGDSRFEDAGKLMALAAYGEPGVQTDEEQSLINHLLETENVFGVAAKQALSESRYFNIGVEHPDFARLARRYSDAIFERFAAFAKKELRTGLPLLIGGGCGLNCDWNRSWEDCGLFSEVFVPPCTNDTGAAIGTAIEAQWHLAGNAKVEWNVYSGQDFVIDETDLGDFDQFPLDLDQVAADLLEGSVLAWVQGRCEIGPRALGNRSILAAPFAVETRERLNEIKERERFRPIAPICLVEDMGLHFDRAAASPHMLFFQNVIDDRLGAVTHIDGSARCQSVSSVDNPRMHGLLLSFKNRSGLGVLCNTSLNFKGAGFINRLSDLARYVLKAGLDGFVVADLYYRRIRK